MKATIHGLRYDTSKARLIGEASHRYGPSGDLTHWSAGLYRTPRAKRFFLAGSGGPMSRWGRRTEGIIPLDSEEALAFAKQYLERAETLAAFGETTAPKILPPPV
jgi:hypothetical protein